MGAMLRFGNPDEPLYSRRAAETGEAVFVPQVPQREVRTQVRPEFHQALTTAGFYSAVSAPIVGTGVVRGSVLASRDTPGRPYTIEDRDLVVAVALRIGAAVAQAERGARGVVAAGPARERSGRVGRARRFRPRARMADGRGPRRRTRGRHQPRHERGRRPRPRSPTSSGRPRATSRNNRSATSSRRPVRSRTRSTGCAPASSTTAPTSCGPSVGVARPWCSTARSSGSRTRRRAACSTSRTRSPTSRPPERPFASEYLSAP